MQTGTKKTPDRFQNYFCPAAANDIVHHAYAWIVKEPNMQPKFLYCRAIDDPANDRGWNIIAEVWERDVLGGWGISSSTIHPEFEDTSDGYVLAEGMPGTVASLPYQVFREVVNEHDTNYLIALAIAIDALPKDSTCDKASETIRANADIDIAERRKSVLPDQAGLAAKKASCIESLAHIGGNAPVCRHGADSPSAPEFRETLRTSRYHHPVHAHDRQPVVRQSGTVPAKPARPICRYRTRGKCLEQPA